MSIDALLSKEYDRENYNCLHFAADSWFHLTGDSRLYRVREKGIRSQRLVNLFRGMRKHSCPTDLPSLALMNTLEGGLHIAVCFRRRLLHINEAGCQFLLVDALDGMYRNMRFYS